MFAAPNGVSVYTSAMRGIRRSQDLAGLGRTEVVMSSTSIAGNESWTASLHYIPRSLYGLKQRDVVAKSCK